VMSVIIRKAEKQDINVCVEMGRGFFDSSLEDDLTRKTNDDRYLVLIAEIDGRIVGFIDAHRQAWNNSLYIERLYVEEKQRRKGYGSGLLTEIKEKARQSKARIIFVDTPPQNKAAMKFYLRNGFQKAGQIDGFYNDPKNQNAIVLSYKL
jgi:ribosomal protein S18 acetylase RimI-like enzyme